MATWHRIGDAAELRARVPCALSVERQTVALFHYDGRFRAIGNACNHKGGPLCQGRLRDATPADAEQLDFPAQR